MDYKFVYTEDALKDLSKPDKPVQVRILKKLDAFSKLRDPMSKSKQLKGFAMATHRFRVGDYRVLFRLDPKSNKLVILVIVKIAHRRNSYS